MKIYLGYIHEDKPAAERIVEYLKRHGHEVSEREYGPREGKIPIEQMRAEREGAEALLVLFSENTTKSKSSIYQLANLALSQAFRQKRKLVVPIKIDAVQLPSYFFRYQSVDLSANFDSALEELISILDAPAGRKTDRQSKAQSFDSVAISARASQVEALRASLRRGRLTLVCGAGVSVEAGIPPWGDLLIRLLDTMLERLSKNHKLELEKKAASEFHKRYGGSSLILGKYLKNNLGKEFSAKMRDALYAGQLNKSSLMVSIAELARPQRDGRPLDSIITFNFDSLIEEYLRDAKIRHKSIFSESIHHHEKELPIYHVHGFLPRVGKISQEAELVFSEDAYHSQFIDPFSWSNLIQLNKLTQNTCLFVGISLTDPNMRRLLDVAWRKNPDKTLSHFIVKRLPQVSDGDVLDEVSRILEEQDANALGLNVIWIKEFNEIPEILSSVAGGVDL